MSTSTTRSLSDWRDRATHYSEAYYHCRRAVVRLREELEHAVDLASRKDRQRRLLGKELAAANLKVRVLAATIEQMRAALEAEHSAVAVMRSNSSGIGL